MVGKVFKSFVDIFLPPENNLTKQIRMQILLYVQLSTRSEGD